MKPPSRRLPYCSKAFGLFWHSDLPLRGFATVDPGDAIDRPAVEVILSPKIPPRGHGRAVNRGRVYRDGFDLILDGEVTCDMVGGTYLTYQPGPDWTGAMPAAFYSTVAAITAAWRGSVPLHASAVEIEGQAILIAGQSGAGKSTLTTGLLALGASFIGDDLSVLTHEGAGFSVWPGRPSIRLHRETAFAIDPAAIPVEDDERGKYLAWPDRRCAEDSVPLGAIILLEEDGGPMAKALGAARLVNHLFRPRWINALPMREALIAQVFAIAQATPLLTMVPMTDPSRAGQLDRAQQAMRMIRVTIAGRGG